MTKYFQNIQKNDKTRCRPSKGRRCIPDVDIKVHVETYLNVDFSSSAQVKIQVKFNFKLFLKKKIKFFGSHVVVGTREDISIEISITHAGINRTDINEAGRPLSVCAGCVSSGYSREGRGAISFIRVWKLGVRTKFNLVNFKLFLYFFLFLGFHAVVLVKTFPLMYQLLMKD